MFESTVTAGTQKTLLLLTEYDEMRRVKLAWRDNGDLVLTERSDGEVTMTSFGSFAHASRVTIPAANVSAAIQALGFGQMSADEAMERFFSHSNVYLSDVEDRLDMAGVSYGFAAWNGGEAAIRAAKV